MNSQRTPPNFCENKVSKNMTQHRSSESGTNEVDDSLNVARRNKRKLDYPHSERSCCDSNQIEELKATIMSWKADQDAILKQLVSDVAQLKTQNQTIKDSNAEIIKSMHFMNTAYEDVKLKMQVLEKEKNILKDCILGLEKKLQDLQFMSRNSSIEIRNIPVGDNESIPELTSVVTRISSALKLDITSNDLRDVYRLPGKRGVNRSIVAEFSTVNKKTTFLSSVVNFNKNRSTVDKLNTETIGMPGKRQPVYVAEYLPPSARRIFYLARNYSKENGYKFCWTSNGNIFIRKEVGDKQILIKSEQCLSNISTTL